MADWSTYSLRDFLMFSAEVYWRLFELANRALWPLPAVTLALGLAAIVLLLWPGPRRRALVLAVMAAAWLWVGWRFVWLSYAPINWAMEYVAPLFALQGLLLAAAALRPWRREYRGGAVLGRGLLVYAVALHPLTAVIAGRPIAGAEIVGVAPDPTAMATLGIVVLVAPLRWVVLLAPLPLLWCAGSALTLHAMDGAWQAAIPALAAVTGLAALVLRR
ncbi:DUF6064 family protein [Minwuia thermotolerans]|uniref:MFS transporter permease n=1 Tax=Minwuia thermotolerans TaxID=2056226 RepID=A0A2M9G770_9PROT|nr:DUF6064 family protein [Minwuia thermotolerans]PJK31568.1 hypothetical protein CVT23_00480 [Minwuia thermotolerans]